MNSLNEMVDSPMQQSSTKFDRLVTLLLPLPFVATGYTNSIAWALGLHSVDMIRMLFTFGLQGITALLLFIKVVSIWKNRPEQRKLFALSGLIYIAYIVLQILGLLSSGDKLSIVKSFISGGISLVGMSSSLLIILSEKKLRTFVRISKYYALAISPIYLYYCLRLYLPSADYSFINLGSLEYMTISYLCLSLCFVLLLEILLYGTDGHGWDSPHINYALIILYSIVLAFSGTRGAAVCLVCMLVLCILYAAATKQHLWQIVIYSLSSFAAVILACTVLYPSSCGDNRIIFFFKEINGQEAGMSAEEIEEALEVISHTQTTPNNITLSEFVISGQADEALADGELTQKQYDSIMDIFQKVNSTSTVARKYLWVCAKFEIKAFPLTGQGAMFFINKYGTYPHNFFLEIATDFGLPIMGAVLLLGIYVFIRLIPIALKRSGVGAFLLYVLMLLPQNIVSGCLYHDANFFMYGFSIIFLFYVSNAMEKKKQQQS